MSLWKYRNDSGLTQQEADDLLEKVRAHAEKIQSAWRNPEYGINVTEETDRMVEAFQKLDTGIKAGFCRVLPRDWER